MPNPHGYHSVTPYLCVRDAARALEFYQRAFGATDVHSMLSPDGGGRIMHAEFKIGDSKIMLSDEFPGASCRSPESANTTTVNLHIYAEDVDKMFHQAVQAGAKAEMPPTDMFWGDRYGKLTDPFGHSWAIAKHVKDVSPEQMQRGAKEMMARMQQQKVQQAKGT